MDRLFWIIVFIAGWMIVFPLFLTLVATVLKKGLAPHKDAKPASMTAFYFIIATMLGIVGLIAFYEPVRLFVWEITFSIFGDALMLGIFFFTVGILIAICQNWKVIWGTLGKTFKDVLEIVLMR